MPPPASKTPTAIDRLAAVRDAGMRRMRRLALRVRPAPPLERPIFVVGTVRSATTLIARLLAEHSQVCQATTRHFELSPEWVELAGIEIGAAVTGQTHCPPLGADDVTDDVRRRVRRGFAALRVEEAGWTTPRFLLKNPHFWNKLPFLHALFPDVELVVTSRDVISTVFSTKQLFERVAENYGVRHYLPQGEDVCWDVLRGQGEGGTDPRRTFPGGDLAVIAEYWLRVYGAIDREAHRFAGVHLLRHGDLLRAPQETMANLHRALGLEPEEGGLAGTVDPSRNERWRAQMTPEGRASLGAFLDEHGDAIRDLRYADTQRVEL